MIDYEKLKEEGAGAIHEAYLITCEKLGWEVKEENKVPYADLSDASKDLDRASFESALNTLRQFGLLNIEKLKELTKPEPKYKVGDNLFWCVSHDIYSGTVSSVTKLPKIYVYTIDGSPSEYIRLSEEQLYPSCQSLIEAQIEYWTRLLKDEISTRSDDMSMSSMEQKTNQVNYSEHVEIEMGESDADFSQSTITVSGKCPNCGDYLRDTAVNLDNGMWRETCLRCSYFRDFDNFESIKCEHEDDGNHYLVQPAMTKCKKCGEFYR